MDNTFKLGHIHTLSGVRILLLKVFETFADTLSAPGPPYDDQHLIRSYVTKEFGGQKLKNGTASQVGLPMLC
jgi:hypothetical protein